MQLYVCTQIDKATNNCLSWLDLNTSMLAITGWQASMIITAIASYYLTMWLLKKSRSNFKR